jgi:hypothetical protein
MIEERYVYFSIFFCFGFWWDWGLNTRLQACKAGTLPHEPHLQSAFPYSSLFLLILANQAALAIMGKRACFVYLFKINDFTLHILFLL